jgi:hypothetical protein
MTFEEEFPSLKKKGVGLHIFQIMGKVDDGTNYHSSTIQEYCLDKQRVREAIDKQCDSDAWLEYEDYDAQTIGMKIKEKLLEGLGL